jgi:prevent-host-death family protein
MPTTIDVNEAEARFEELVAKVEADQEFVICRDGAPLVRLIPVDAERPCDTPVGDDGRR